MFFSLIKFECGFCAVLRCTNSTMTSHMDEYVLVLDRKNKVNALMLVRDALDSNGTPLFPRLHLLHKNKRKANSVLGFVKHGWEPSVDEVASMMRRLHMAVARESPPLMESAVTMEDLHNQWEVVVNKADMINNCTRTLAFRSKTDPANTNVSLQLAKRYTMGQSEHNVMEHKRDILDVLDDVQFMFKTEMARLISSILSLETTSGPPAAAADATVSVSVSVSVPQNGGGGGNEGNEGNEGDEGEDEQEVNIPYCAATDGDYKNPADDKVDCMEDDATPEEESSIPCDAKGYYADDGGGADGDLVA